MSISRGIEVQRPFDSGSTQRPLGLLARVARCLRDEVAVLHVRESSLLAVAALFPRQTFGYLRTALLRAAGLRIGPRSRIHGPVVLTGPRHRAKLLAVGEECLITGPLHCDLAAEVHIERGTQLGPEVMLLTIDHEIGPASQRAGVHSVAPIRIGEGAWLGARVTVLPGVSIGAGAVVAAGSLVTRDVPPNVLVGGVPARQIRRLDDAPEHEFATHNPSWTSLPPIDVR